ncbi:MAG: hypothetical protein ABMA14_12900 [Hyphomonadaceae bacterium]
MAKNRPAQHVLIAAAIQLLMSSSSMAQPQMSSPERLLKQAIERAEILSGAYSRASRERGEPLQGNVLANYGVKEHRCTALGTLLGWQPSIEALKEILNDEGPPPPTEKADNDSELSSQKIYLDNFVRNARFTLEEPDDERAISWNLDCVGYFGIPGEAAVRGPISRAKLRVEDDTLIVLGDIEAGFAEEFARAVATNSKIKRVTISSGGGGLAEAIRAGYMIRALRLDTELYGNCFSACVFLFMGGVERRIWRPYPDLGFHQVSTDHGDVSPGNKVYTGIGDFADAMGVNRRFVLAAMFAAKPEDMYASDIFDLCDNHVVTFIQGLRAPGQC